MINNSYFTLVNVTVSRKDTRDLRYFFSF